MGYLTPEEFKRFRAEGRSEQEIAYFDAENQKDYEPLLKDPDTPEKVITDIVDRITLVPLKILAFKHPNISERQQRYMLEKADKKKYQKDLIRAFITADKELDGKQWRMIKKYYNTAKRFEKFIIELINEQADISTQKLDTILNNIKDDKDLQTIGFPIIQAIFSHKNFDTKILYGNLFTKNKGLVAYNHIMQAIENSPQQADIATTLYEITEREEVLPPEAKQMFIF